MAGKPKEPSVSRKASGIIPVVLTPYRDDGTIDWDGYEPDRMVHRQRIGNPVCRLPIVRNALPVA